MKQMFELYNTLKVNNHCYGELPKVVRAVMNDIGVQNFVIRGKTDWHHLTAEHNFDPGRTYRLDKNWYPAVLVEYSSDGDVWGFDANGWIAYTSSPAVHIIEGMEVRFVGYVYDNELVPTPRRTKPFGGVWEIL